MTKIVGARELKTRLGTYLRMAREGATVVVTQRGRPVAELRPVSQEEDPLALAAREMEALGEISHPFPEPLGAAEPLALPEARLSAAIRDDRADRL